MKSQDKIIEKLKQELASLERERLATVRRLNQSYFWYLLPFFFLITAMLTGAIKWLAFSSFVLALVSWGGIFAVKVLKPKKNYKLKLKHLLFSRLVQEHEWLSSYQQDAQVSESEYLKANLFKKHDKTRFLGEDLFTGNFQGHELSFSYARTESVMGESTHVHFYGFFFDITLLKKLGSVKAIGKTQRFEKDKQINWRKVRPSGIDVLFPDFSRLYKIWTKDKESLEYLLKTNLLNILNRWILPRYPKSSLAIEGDKLYFAYFSGRKTMHKVNIRTTLQDTQVIEQLLKEFNRCIEIAESLVEASKEVIQNDVDLDDLLDLDGGNNIYQSLIIN